MHALLQYLPGIAPDDRQGRALAFLDRAAPEWPEDHAAWAQEALAVLADPAIAMLFAGSSRAEVPLAGRLPRPGKPDYTVTGRIDRLSVSSDEIWIADFKTNRRPPASVADVPPAYISQLALYRHLLTKLYPGRLVRAALIWTANVDVMELPAAILEAAVDDLMR